MQTSPKTTRTWILPVVAVIPVMILAVAILCRAEEVQRVLDLGGATAEVSIGRAGAVNRYRFHASVAGDYRIETHGTTQLDVTLFGPNDAQRRYPLNDATDRDSTPDLVNRRLTVRLEPGEYVVQVRHARVGGMGEYRIGVTLLDEISAAKPSKPIDCKPPAPYAGTKHALLIGCTGYAELDAPLVGPKKDVLLLERLLVDRFGFPPGRESIVKLVEANGEMGEHGMPTKANIEAAFQDLATRAKAGDFVFIAFSGHGAQQKDVPDPADPEPDGYDEILLPTDAQRGTYGGVVPSAIVDDELRNWLQRFDRDVNVCLLIDACQSGTATRGEIARTVPVDKLFEIPAESSADSSPVADAVRGSSDQPDFDTAAPDRTNQIAVYACLPNEVTVELPFLRDQSEEVYGLLTYTLTYVLENAKSPLTYRQLVDRIYAQYAAWGRFSPTPLVEGALSDMFVFQAGTVRPRDILLTKSGGEKLQINAGKLHGLTPRTMLAVRPAAGEADPEKIVGYVEIPDERSLGVLRSTVLLTDYNGLLPNRPALSFPGRCTPVAVELGDQRLQIAVMPKPHDGQAEGVPAAKAADQLRETLQRMCLEQAALFQVVAKEEGKSIAVSWIVWIARRDDRPMECTLVPAAALDNDGREILPLATPLGFAGESPPERQLFERLQRLARAEALKTIAADIQNVWNNPRDLNVEARFKVRRQGVGEWCELEPAHGGIPTVRAGDHFAFDLQNTSPFSVDVSILFVTSDHGIYQYYPDPHLVLNNRIPSGQTVATELDDGYGILKADTEGLERMIVIAVQSPSQGPPVDFGLLTQHGLRQAVGQERGIPPSDIARQLRVLFPRAEGTRFGEDIFEQIQFQVFTWRTTK